MWDYFYFSDDVACLGPLDRSIAMDLIIALYFCLTEGGILHHVICRQFILYKSSDCNGSSRDFMDSLDIRGTI